MSIEANTALLTNQPGKLSHPTVSATDSTGSLTASVYRVFSFLCNGTKCKHACPCLVLRNRSGRTTYVAPVCRRPFCTSIPSPVTSFDTLLPPDHADVSRYSSDGTMITRRLQALVTMIASGSVVIRANRLAAWPDPPLLYAAAEPEHVETVTLNHTRREIAREGL